MNYLNQIFYEGLGKRIYVPIENKIKKNNNKLSKILIVFLKFLYMIMVIAIAILLFVIRL